MWFFQKNSVSQGPFSEQQIQELIRKGTVTGETLVWSEGTSGWIPAEKTVLISPHALSEPPLPVLSPPESRDAAQAYPSRFQNLTPLTNWLTGLFGFYLLLKVGLIFSHITQLHNYNGLLSGEVSRAVALAFDLQARILTHIHTATYCVVVIVFCRWVYVAAKNVRRLGAWGLNFTPGWAVGYYFLPILNLWRPYQAMKEIWQASRSPHNWKRQKGGFILIGWWYLWQADNVVGNLILRGVSNYRGPGHYAMLQTDMIFLSVIGIALCIVSILLVRNITAAQIKSASAIQE